MRRGAGAAFWYENRRREPGWWFPYGALPGGLVSRVAVLALTIAGALVLGGVVYVVALLVFDIELRPQGLGAIGGVVSYPVAAWVVRRIRGEGHSDEF